jgi:hypothetical protein
MSKGETEMKMDRIYGIIGLAALVIVAVAVGLAVDAGAYEMRSNREKRVRVDVKPVQLVPGQPAKFEVQMNTHSETLGEDMVAVSSLKDNAGRICWAIAGTFCGDKVQGDFAQKSVSCMLRVGGAALIYCEIVSRNCILK